MKDTKTRKAQACVARNRLGKIWKSSLRRKIKVRLFLATIESAFLCGTETWTLTKNTEKLTNGVFARMLRIALNLLRDHISSKDLYGHLIPKAQGHPMTVFCEVSVQRSKIA